VIILIKYDNKNHGYQSRRSHHFIYNKDYLEIKSAASLTISTVTQLNSTQLIMYHRSALRSFSPLKHTHLSLRNNNSVRCCLFSTNSSGKEPGRVVVITSGKGGVGKTTSAASIGYGLAQKGFKTCLIDFDIGLRNLDLHLVCQSTKSIFDLRYSVC
jgi:Mrp family chromosome partitioning ATPase